MVKSASASPKPGSKSADKKKRRKKTKRPDQKLPLKLQAWNLAMAEHRKACGKSFTIVKKTDDAYPLLKARQDVILKELEAAEK